MPIDLKLTNANDNVYSFSISCLKLKDQILVGRAYEGPMFIWKNILSKNLQIREYNDPRILGLPLSTENKSILILDV